MNTFTPIFIKIFKMKKGNIKMRIIALILLLIFIVSCSQIPKNTRAVENFEIDKYLGKWYEIARLDFKYERNLNNTTAHYSIDEKGNLKVVNQGFNYVKNEWTKAEAVGKFRGLESVGELKVSFFGPFYSGYNIIELDQNYQYALVAGKNLDYLWILSRNKTIPDSIKNKYLETAQKIGYNTSELIWVTHDKENPNKP